MLSILADDLDLWQDQLVTERLNATSRTARGIAREQLTAAIVTSARAQLGSVGAAALSVRAVARDVGMVSSAVYRYFPSRDDLLTALLIACYDELGDAVEAADRVVERSDLTARWFAIAYAVRRWALDHPFDWALLYGSPVPGYAAPEATIGPGTRVSRLLIGLLSEAPTEAVPVPPAGAAAVEEGLTEATAQIAEFVGGRIDDELLLRGLIAWTGLIGAVSLELFGQFGRSITDPDLYFDAVVRRLIPFGG